MNNETMNNEQWPMTNGQWPMTNGQRVRSWLLPVGGCGMTHALVHNLAEDGHKVHPWNIKHQVQRTFAIDLSVLRCNLLDEIAEMARNKCVAPYE